MSDYSQIKLLVIDVDGTMTDAGIYYDENGNEQKKFCTKDAAGFFCAHAAGIEIMVLTGRECAATSRRMKEMKVEYLCQNVINKYDFLLDFIREHALKYEQIGYIGDDLNDLSPMTLAGFVGCPEDACDEIKAFSDYISSFKGGHGAVRDIISYLLKQRGQWEDAYMKVYHIQSEIIRNINNKRGR